MLEGKRKKRGLESHTKRKKSAAKNRGPAGFYEAAFKKENEGRQIDLPHLTLDMIKILFASVATRFGRPGIYRCDASEAVYAFEKSINPKAGLLAYSIAQIPYKDLHSGGMNAFYKWRDTLPKEIYMVSHKTKRKRKEEEAAEEEGCSHGIPLSKWCSICTPRH